MVIGAMKSGTTSLWKYLHAHPEVFMSYPKEPGFFVEELTWSKGWGWYESLFSQAQGTTAIGEASTHYTKFPFHKGVPERIAAHLPEVRFIYVMREPLRRTLSHYWYAVHDMGETRSIERALRNDPSYVDFGRYALQIEQYLPYFPQDRFYFTTFERLVTQPNVVVQEVFEFLGVDASKGVSEIGEVHNATPSNVRCTRRLLHRIRWSPWWTRVAPYVPRGIKELAKRHEFTTKKKSHLMSQRTRERLESVFADENERLFDLIGRRFDEWQSDAVTNESAS